MDTEAVLVSILLLLARSAAHAVGVTLTSVHCSLPTVLCSLSTKKRYLTAGASSRAAALGLSAALTTHCVVIHYRLVRFAYPALQNYRIIYIEQSRLSPSHFPREE